MAGAMAWRAEDARDVLEMYRSLTEQAPPELTGVAALRIAPPAPWLPKDVHGKPIIALFVCDMGPVKEGERRVAPIKAFGSPVGDVIQRRPYVSQQSLIDTTQPKGRRYYWKSEYLPKLEPEMLTKGIEHAERIVSPHSAILLFPLDGTLNRLPENYSPVGNRDAALVLNIAASWENVEDDKTNIEWARGVAGHVPLLDGRHIYQFPNRRGGRRAHSHRLWEELCPARRGQDEVGPGEPVPDEQEHRAAGVMRSRVRTLVQKYFVRQR